MQQRPSVRVSFLVNQLARIVVVACVNSLVCYGQCDPAYSWANWSTFQNNTLSGSLWNGVKDIGITVRTNYEIKSTPVMYIISRFSKFPQFSTLPRSTTPRVDWAGGKEGQTTICFSEPVTNPVLILASLGNPRTPVKITFSRPYVPLFADGGSELIDNYSIRGAEGNAILLFPGTIDCITVTSNEPEYFSDFTWGIQASAFPLAVSAPLGGCRVSSVTATGGVSYQWSGGQTPTAATNVFDQDGIYTVTATNDNGCTAYNAATITIPPETAVQFGTYPPLCNGQSLTLSPSVTAASGSVRYRWSSGETTPTITATKPGLYEVRVQDAGCVKAASVNLVAAQPPILPPSTSVCLAEGGNVLEVGTSEPGLTYNWLSMNSQASTVKVSKAGRYLVNVTNPAGCSAVRTIEVVSPPVVALGPARGICPGVETELRPTLNVPDAYSYRWSTGESEPIARVSEPGVYQVTATNGICTASASLVLTANPIPEVRPDETICRDKTIAAGSLTTNVTYLWEHQGETTPSIAIQTEGVYRVRITNPIGCSVVRTITVSGVCPSHVLAPTAFTPNGDGLNDVFKPIVAQGDVVELLIYNRWGEPVYLETGNQPQWDGRQNGQACLVGSYTYQLIYRTLQNDGNQTYRGTITLLR